MFSMRMPWVALVLSLLVSGCAAVPPAGRERLHLLRGGMTMAEVIRLLGEPTARIEVGASRQGGVYSDLSYVDTIVDPGVVELYFRPTLSEVFIDTELYREY